MRLLIIWMGAAVVVVAATAGLLWWSTESSAQFQVDGTRLSVSGQLTLASTERLDRLLEEFDGLETLVLGDIAPESDPTSMLQKGLLVRGAGLSTEVAGGVTLAGDAVYLFLAGVDRQLGEGAALVVSDWQTRVGPASLLPMDHPAHQERLDYVRRMVGGEDFYWVTLDAGEGTPISEADLTALGVLTAG
jgi:hypothetical protein